MKENIHKKLLFSVNIYIYNKKKMNEGMGQPGQRLLTAFEKVWSVV